MSMADEGADVDALMEEVGELQDRLETRDFYTLDAKIDEVARALGCHGFWHGYRCNGPFRWSTYQDSLG